MRLTICMLFTLFAVARSTNLKVVSQENIPSAPLPSNGAAVDEVVVESSLYIKPKPKTAMVRRTRRSIAQPDLNSLIEHKRVKRQPQHRRQNNNLQSDAYGQSQAAANAAANYHNQFGSSASNAGAQAFNAFGPAGSFGASSAGTVAQAHNGLQNSAGASMSQTYTLPNGQTINFANTNSFANGPFGNNANSRGGAISVSDG